MSQQRQVGRHATSIFTEAGKTRVVYHGTAVVIFDSERIILDSGGWRTATTKSRMNQASHQFELGIQVYQKGGKWWVIGIGNGRPCPIEFSDGMTILRERSA
jgi:hypothetical protein